MIAVLLIGTVRSVGRRLMDGIEPELVDRAEHALQHLAEVESVESVRLRWVGHRLHGDALVRTSATSLAEADHLAEDAEAAVKKRMPNVDEMTVRVMANVR
jgi:divalent metal cation (Fe/Co/Zn/Cd) transporter